MSSFTTNLNLVKPTINDPFNVEDANGNMQKIDDAYGKVITLTGTTAPTTATIGTKGQFYLDTTTNTLYQCTNIDNSTYTWGMVLPSNIGDIGLVRNGLSQNKGFVSLMTALNSHDILRTYYGCLTSDGLYYVCAGIDGYLYSFNCATATSSANYISKISVGTAVGLKVDVDTVLVFIASTTVKIFSLVNGVLTLTDTKTLSDSFTAIFSDRGQACERDGENIFFMLVNNVSGTKTVKVYRYTKSAKVFSVLASPVVSINSASGYNIWNDSIETYYGLVYSAGYAGTSTSYPTKIIYLIDKLSSTKTIGSDYSLSMQAACLTPNKDRICMRQFAYDQHGSVYYYTEKVIDLVANSTVYSMTVDSSTFADAFKIKDKVYAQKNYTQVNNYGMGWSTSRYYELNLANFSVGECKTVPLIQSLGVVDAVKDHLSSSSTFNEYQLSLLWDSNMQSTSTQSIKEQFANDEPTYYTSIKIGPNMFVKSSGAYVCFGNLLEIGGIIE